VTGERDVWRERLRAVCLSLPETVEKPMFADHCDWRVGEKIFCFGPGYGADAGVTVGLKVGKEVMAAMVAADPRISVMRYIGRHGWVTVDLRAGTGAADEGRWDGALFDEALWDDVEELVRGSYRLVAPARLARLVP